MYVFGLLVYESSRLVLDSLQVNKFWWRIAACKSLSINISNTNIQNCSSLRAGLLMSDSDGVFSVNVSSQSNLNGIMLVSTSHTTIINNTLLNNVGNVIVPKDAKHSDILYFE